MDSHGQNVWAGLRSKRPDIIDSLHSRRTPPKMVCITCSLHLSCVSPYFPTSKFGSSSSNFCLRFYHLSRVYAFYCSFTCVMLIFVVVHMGPSSSSRFTPLTTLTSGSFCPINYEPSSAEKNDRMFLRRILCHASARIHCVLDSSGPTQLTVRSPTPSRQRRLR